MALSGGRKEIPQENVKHGRDQRNIRKRQLPVSAADAISLINSPAGRAKARQKARTK
jgi:hypothetical protein